MRRHPNNIFDVMADKKFNPFDLTGDKAGKSDKNPIQIAIRPELSDPLNLFLGRCEMFLDRAKALSQMDLALELQKILSTGKYLQTLLTSSDEIRKAKLGFEIGVPSGEVVRSDAVIGDPMPRNAEQRERGAILVVDDDKRTLDLLKFVLEQQGHTVVTASNGEDALASLHGLEFDVILSDITMPEMNGFQFLDFLKADMVWRNIPVIILSGNRETKSAARCIQTGAEDYLTKPIDAVLLQARVNACLEKKRLRDLEQAYVNRLQAEQDKSERLLLNILPAPIAERLKKGESVIADSFAEVTVLFADIAGFTRLATQVSPAELVQTLNDIFSAFDRLAEKHALEKIKTIGDAYMVVGGLPKPLPKHANAVAAMALDMQREILRINGERRINLGMRIGIHTGPVVAGVIGKKKFSYDLWGDTVNTASRMEAASHPGHIQVSEATFELIKDRFFFAKRQPIETKGKGEMNTYLLRQGHPWLYESSIREQNRPGICGELAVVYDRNDQFLAAGLYDPDSPIRVRVLFSGKPQTLDANWWRQRLEGALKKREGLFGEQTTGFRCIHGESDGWPGLVLDRYEAALVLKIYTGIWLGRLEEIKSLLQTVLPEKSIVLRLSRNIQVRAAEHGLRDGQWLTEKTAENLIVFRETGLKFEANVVQGQKTGFFLYQRDNRRIVE